MAGLDWGRASCKVQYFRQAPANPPNLTRRTLHTLAPATRQLRLGGAYANRVRIRSRTDAESSVDDSVETAATTTNITPTTVGGR